MTILRPLGGRLQVVRRFAASGGPNRLAVDRAGRIWAAMWDASELVAWDPRRATSQPIIMLHVEGMQQPTGLGFDNRGWLWVTTQHGQALLGISPAQLQRSASVRPARQVRLPGGSTALNEDVAFDARGRAYFVQYQAEKLVIFTSLQAARPKPERVIDLPTDGPVGVRRGPDGAIWVTNSTAANLLRLTNGGARRQTIRIAAAQMPHTVTFVGQRAYVTDSTVWLLEYRTPNLLTGSARPTFVANPLR
jgi:sugar lactone lactonase YvrE